MARYVYREKLHDAWMARDLLHWWTHQKEKLPRAVVEHHKDGNIIFDECTICKTKECFDHEVKLVRALRERGIQFGSYIHVRAQYEFCRQMQSGYFNSEI